MKSILMSIALVLLIAGCSKEPDIIKVGEGDWDSNAFHDQVAKFIIENGYGAKLDIITADTAVMVSGLKTNKIDMSMELWSDNIPTYQDDIDAGDYVALSTNFDDNMQGLYVPTYVVEGDDAVAPDLTSVSQLKDYANLFPDPEDPSKGIIYGGPEGWSATEFLHNKIEALGLDEVYNFRTIDSGATLAATLSGAYQRKEPWLGYYWEPTWVMGLYDMTLIDDEPYSEENFNQGIGAFPTVDVQVVATPDFVEKHPEITAFLKNYTTSSELTSQALGYMQDNEAESEEAAVWFLKENDMWKDWVSDEALSKIESALDAY